MKKLIVAILVGFLFFPLSLQAQELNENLGSETTEVEETVSIEPGIDLMPVITADNIVEVSGNIIFKASSPAEEEGDVLFEWNFGDGTEIVQGKEVVHTYQTAGSYQVTLTAKRNITSNQETVDENEGGEEGLGQQEESATISQGIFVYNKLLFLLTDVSEKKEDIENLRLDAQDEGTYIVLIESYDSTTAFMSEEALFTKLRDQFSSLSNADALILWTTRSSGINALTRLAQETNESEGQQNPVQGKDMLIITMENLNSMSRIMQGNFDIIEPRQMIIARQHDLKNFTTALSTNDFLDYLESSLSDYRVVNAETGKLSIWNAISSLVSFMISQGVPSNTIILLLMLPVIATIIALLKNVIGITTFGVYIPAVITLSFSFLGLNFGLLILFIIILTGAFVRKILSGWRLLHVPRMAILLTISALIILLTLAFGTYLGVTSIASLAVFPMLIMTTLAEKFVTALSGKGFFKASLLMLETTLVSLICYWVVEWHYLQNLILGRPEIILLLLLVNYALGRWTGLRLMEYVRFREVMKHAEE